jgi:hypothetical protein
MSGQVESDRSALWVAALELSQRRAPHSAIERQAVQQDERRTCIGRPALFCGETGEPGHALLVGGQLCRSRVIGHHSAVSHTWVVERKLATVLVVDLVEVDERP